MILSQSTGMDMDVRQKAQILFDMLADDMNYLYLLFLSPIVDDFEKTNMYYQALKAEP